MADYALAKNYLTVLPINVPTLLIGLLSGLPSHAVAQDHQIFNFKTPPLSSPSIAESIYASNPVVMRINRRR